MSDSIRFVFIRLKQLPRYTHVYLFVSVFKYRKLSSTEVVRTKVLFRRSENTAGTDVRGLLGPTTDTEEETDPY